MGKKSKKSKTKRRRTPPLSFLDKTIYITAFILGTAFSIFIFVAYMGLVESIAFNDPGAVAYYPGAGMLLCLPLLCFIMGLALAPSAIGLDNKRPLFGNPKIKYGEHPYREDCYPLFSKKKYHVNERPVNKRMRLFTVVLLCIIFLISAALFPFSLYNRTVLYSNNSIKKFNVINEVTKVYTEDDFESLTISARRVTHGKGDSRWESLIDIELSDGEDIQFSIDDFDLRTPEGKDVYLEKMLELKSILPAGKITIEGAENVEKVAEEWDFTEEQTRKLEEIFS